MVCGCPSSPCRGKSPREWQFMQRGCRNTDTNSTKSAPLLAGVAEAVALVAGRSAALIGWDSDIVPVKIRTVVPMAMGTDVRQYLIQPPSYGSAACGYVSRLRRTPHLRWPGLCTVLPALQCHLTSHCSPQCGFQFPDTHSCASRGKCENSSAATSHSRM